MDARIEHHASSGSTVSASSIRKDEPLSAATASGMFAGTQTGCDPVVPHPSDPKLGYGIHEVRHLVEQLAFGVGIAWLAANPDWQDRVGAQVFADATLNHGFAEAYNYKDLEANRPVWVMRAALGDPDSATAGIIDLLVGVSGARKRWDENVIRSALSKLAAGEEQLVDANSDQARAEAGVARATRQLDRKPRVSGDIETGDTVRALLLVQQRLADMTARDELRDVREAAREQRRESEHRISSAEKLIAGASAELLLIRERGRTAVIDDLAHLPADFPAGETAPEKQTFDQALEIITSTIRSVDVATATPAVCDEALLRKRVHLNLEEYAAVHDVHVRTARRWLDGTRVGPVPSPRLRAATVVLGDRRRYIRVEILPDSWWAGLSPAQRELVEQLLRIPMGATQFGGADEAEKLLAAISL